MSPRTGRPIAGESKKDLRLQLRLSREEMDLIDECSERTGENRRETVMHGVQLLKCKLDEQ